MIDSIFKYVQGIVRLKGTTDGTPIGNVSDSLKVTSVSGSISEIKENKCYHACIDGVVIGNNKSMISISNAPGSPVVIKIKEIYMVNDQNNAITGIVSNFNLKRFTTHSGGTAISPISNDTNDTLNANVTIKTGATISGETTPVFKAWKYSSDEWGIGAQDVASGDHSMNSIFPIYEAQPGSKPITIRPGEGIHIKHIVNSTVGTFAFCIVFDEV